MKICITNKPSLRRHDSNKNPSLKLGTIHGGYSGMYDYVIVTHIPAFYKVNLYEQLNQHLKIYVIFIAEQTSEVRTNDFIRLNDLQFDYAILNKGTFQTRNLIMSVARLRRAISMINYKKIILSGWDLPEFWYLALSHQQKKICLSLESTARESVTKGIKKYVKMFFLGRISKVFASGKEHVRLLKQLKYKYEIKITNGVGIINKPKFIKHHGNYQKKFLFIGRLSEVKNLEFLIEVFNCLPEHKLTIIGNGPLLNVLQKKSYKNITYLHKIENSNIPDQFYKHDVLILPSLSEPWGLVIEEAMYFGLPVIASNMCGASELISHGLNGFLFNPKDSKELKDIIENINEHMYQKLRYGIDKLSIDNKDLSQVVAYL